MELQPCRWNVIIHNCRGSAFFVTEFYISSLLFLLAFIVGACVLTYRVRWKKHTLWDPTLSTLDSFMLINAFGFSLGTPLYPRYFNRHSKALILLTRIAGRGIGALVLAMDGFPQQHYVAWSSAMHDIPWTFGRVSMWVYILSIVQMTPRHCTNVFLPSVRLLNKLRVIIIVIEVTSISALSVAAGYAYDAGDIAKFEFLTMIDYGVTSIYCVILAGGFGFFGRQMVRIVTLSAKEVKENTQSVFATTMASKRSTTRSDMRMRKAIIKMKIFNFACLWAFLWFGAILGIFAFLQTEMFGLLWWSKIQSLGAEVFIPGLNLWVQVVLAWGEVFPKKDIVRDVLNVGHFSGVERLQERR
ncbi:hypothetical protein DFS34DRAFT_638601 [Phlyctochytrium arcticum]|nr:hypothetical protein DFS34DRAFT_638601 [Phlyctochytrium arcticum]